MVLSILTCHDKWDGNITLNYGQKTRLHYEIDIQSIPHVFAATQKL